MRQTPSDAHTIIDLLEKCRRNLLGVELRTLTREGRITSVEFSKEEMKKVAKLVIGIEGSLSILDDRLKLQHEVIKAPKPPKPVEKKSALQEYMRKYK